MYESQHAAYLTLKLAAQVRVSACKRSARCIPVHEQRSCTPASAAERGSATPSSSPVCCLPLKRWKMDFLPGSPAVQQQVLPVTRCASQYQMCTAGFLIMIRSCIPSEQSAGSKNMFRLRAKKTAYLDFLEKTGAS